MLLPRDKENLEKAQQAVDLAQQSIKELYTSENPLLAEHGLEMIEQIAKVNQKLKRLLAISK